MAALRKEQFTYNRSQPREWPAIVELADAAITACGAQPDFNRTTELIEHVDTLGNLDLDTNRYYGVGKGICQLAQKLPNPIYRHRIIDGGAHSLAAWQRERHAAAGTDSTAGLRLSEFRGDRIGSGFAEVVDESLAALPSAERLTLDALSVVALARRPTKPGQEPLTRIPLPAIRYTKRVLTDNLGSRIIQSGSFAGASFTSRLALTKYHLLQQQQAGIAPEEMNSDPFLHEVADEATIRDVLTRSSSKELAKYLAKLRFDEFTYNAHTYVDADPEHVTRFVRTRVPMRPLPQPGYAAAYGMPSFAIRDERLRCPAMFVHGLVDAVMEIIPDIILGANERIRAAATTFAKQ